MGQNIHNKSILFGLSVSERVNFTLAVSCKLAEEFLLFIIIIYYYYLLYYIINDKKGD